MALLTVDRLLYMIEQGVDSHTAPPSRCISADEYMIRKVLLMKSRDEILGILQRDHWARLSAIVPRIVRPTTLGKIIWQLSVADRQLANHIIRLKSISEQLLAIDQMVCGRIMYAEVSYEGFF